MEQGLLSGMDGGGQRLGLRLRLTLNCYVRLAQLRSERRRLDLPLLAPSSSPPPLLCWTRLDYHIRISRPCACLTFGFPFLDRILY